MDRTKDLIEFWRTHFAETNDDPDCWRRYLDGRRPSRAQADDAGPRKPAAVREPVNFFEGMVFEVSRKSGMFRENVTSM